MDENSNIRRLRASQRFKLFLPTCMRLGHRTVLVHLIDVSATGALVLATEPAAVGAKVYIRMLGGNRAARVVRRDGRQFGVEFAARLSDAELATLLHDQDTAAA